MNNIRPIKREPSQRMLDMADRLEALAVRMRQGEVESVAFTASDLKQSDSGYVFGQDAMSLLGAVHLLQADLTDIVRSW